MIFKRSCRFFGALGAFVAIVAVPAVAGAQQAAQSPRDLPPPRSYEATPPPPPPPKVTGLDIAVAKEAGIGGTQAYARAGVLELGGALGMTMNTAYQQVNIAPSIGYFLVDNLELSAISNFSFLNTENGKPQGSFTGLVEPSYHMPFTDYLYGFLGSGFGLNTTPRGTGLAFVPRLGVNIMVGRSGILTPALSLVYSTAESLGTVGSSGDHFALAANVGYSVMW